MEGIDAIFISHGHDDHLHPPSLLGVPETVPIYFFNEDLATCSCPVHPQRLFRQLGFRDVHPFDPGDAIHLPEDVTIHIIPAQASTEGEEQCCFLIETPDVCMVDAVDVKDAVVTRDALAAYRGKVDLAFVPTGAGLQFEGFWNQMDTIQAVDFCRWLEPAKVMTCGGALSLSAKPTLGTLERYPYDLADWLAAASRQFGPDQLLRQRAPYHILTTNPIGYTAVDRCISITGSTLVPAHPPPERS